MIPQQDSKNINLLDYVSQLQTCLTEVNELARQNLQSTQKKMKNRYDREAVEQKFEVCDQVLVLLFTSVYPLKARYHGPLK